MGELRPPSPASSVRIFSNRHRELIEDKRRIRREPRTGISREAAGCGEQGGSLSVNSEKEKIKAYVAAFPLYDDNFQEGGDAAVAPFMMWTIRRILVLAGLAVALTASGVIGAESVAPATTTDPSHPFVKALEARYDAYHQAAQAGDVKAYKATRTAETVSEIEAHLREQNKLDQFGLLIRKIDGLDPTYRDFQFVQCEAKAQAARLCYQREAKAPEMPNNPRVEFLILMFHQENSDWKIGYMKHAVVQKIRPDGTPADLNEYLADERFRLS